MKKYAIAKIFLGNGDDVIVHGLMEKVESYICDIYESNCIMKDTDLSEYEDKCDKCEDLGQECPTLVASHEINLSANELDECLKDYKKDLNWAEVVNLI